VDQRRVGRDHRLVGVEPARHDLLDEIVIGLERKLRIWRRPTLARIGIPRARAQADAEALEWIGAGEEVRLARPYVAAREAGTAALDRVRNIDVPSLADEHVEPAFAAIRRGLVTRAGEGAAVPHQERQPALAILRQG